MESPHSMRGPSPERLDRLVGGLQQLAAHNGEFSSSSVYATIVRSAIEEIERLALKPAEAIALTVALAQVLRGEEPTPNIASVCVLALARLTGKHDWTDVSTLCAVCDQIRELHPNTHPFTPSPRWQP